MPSVRLDDLAYGHLGKATYGSQLAKWHFERQPGTYEKLQLVGNHAIFVRQRPQEAFPSNIRSACFTKTNAKELLRQEPILAPAAHLLPTLARVSEAAQHATSTYDSLISALLAFGVAADLRSGGHSSGTVNVVAVAGGSSGELVRIIPLVDGLLEEQSASGVVISYLEIESTAQLVLSGRGSPILQLCFSGHREGCGEWLAMRWSAVTRVFKPTIQARNRSVTAPNVTSAFDTRGLPRSFHDSCVIDLPITLTGGATHVDVTFNPWTQDQIAVLDSNYSWSVWNLKKKTDRNDVLTLEAGPFGSSADCTTHGQPINDHPDYMPLDGWGTILWVYNATTIVVAKRNSIILHAIMSGAKRSLVHDLGAANRTDWIFDVKRDAIDPTYVFVLTSSRIFWLKIQVDAANIEHPPMAVTLLVIRHFRSQDDRSLSLCINGSGEMRLVLLYSRSIELVTGFTLVLSSSLDFPQVLSDPFELELRDKYGMEINRGEISPALQKYNAPYSLHIAPLTQASASASEMSEPGSALLEEQAHFYQVFVLYKDLSVSEGIYALRKRRAEPSIGNHAYTLVRRSGMSSRRSISHTFISPDGYTSDAGKEDSEDPLLFVKPALHRKNPLALGETPATSDLEWLAVAFEASKEAKKPHAGSVEETISTLQDAVDGIVHKSHGIHILCDLLTHLQIKDVVVASNLIQCFVNAVDSGSLVDTYKGAEEISSGRSLRTSLLWSAEMSNAVQSIQSLGNDVLILPIYEYLLNLWFGSLGSVVPSRTRVSLDQDLRRLAVELYLSSLGLQDNSILIEATEEFRSTDVRDEIDLPLRRKRSMEFLIEKGKQRVSDSAPYKQRVKGPLQNVPSMLESSEAASSLHSQRTVPPATNSEFQSHEGLESLVALGFRPPLTASLSRLIDHWEIGVDPMLYDWERVEHVISSKDDADGSGKISLRRRRQRFEKRLQRQQENILGASSQPEPSTWFSSQPAQIREAQSSSQVKVPSVLESQVQLNASQVESQRLQAQKSKRFLVPKKHKPGFG